MLYAEDIVLIVAITGMAIFILGGPLVGYTLDKGKCYDMAENYGATVEDYSWLKDYCFVVMPSGETVNLDNYRDINAQ